MRKTAQTSPEKKPPRVVIAGGGFGGLEAAFYLRYRLGNLADLMLVSNYDYFLFKPNTIYIPFGKDPSLYKIPYRDGLKEQKITFKQSTVTGVDPERKVVLTENGTLSYDYLIIATGASMRAEEIPGLGEYAHTIWTVEEMIRLRHGLTIAMERARDGKSQKILFLVPPNNKCSGPLYELVMMTDTYLRRVGLREQFEIGFVTFERSYIQSFGPRLHEVVSQEFTQRSITGYLQSPVASVERQKVLLKSGDSLTYDLLVSFPPYIASTQFSALPHDDRGFLLTDFSTRQLQGHPDIYVVGDAGDFPVKQAFLALIQADTAGEHLAQRILGLAPSARFDPISMCIMEQFDKATFARVPLELTSDPALPVRVRESLLEVYQVGQGKIWRMGKKLLGTVLPHQFERGKPFHAGPTWKVMEAGLKVMSTLFAEGS